MKSAEEFAKQLLGAHEILRKVAGSGCAMHETVFAIESDRAAAELRGTRSVLEEIRLDALAAFRQNPSAASYEAREAEAFKRAFAKHMGAR